MMQNKLIPDRDRGKGFGRKMLIEDVISGPRLSASRVASSCQVVVKKEGAKANRS